MRSRRLPPAFADQLLDIETAERVGVGESPEAGNQVVCRAMPVKVLHLTVKLLDSNPLDHTVLLEEAIQLATGAEPQNLPQLWAGQAAGAVFLKGECFDHAAPELGFGAKAGRQVIGDGDHDVHAWEATRALPRAQQSRMIKEVIMRESAE